MVKSNMQLTRHISAFVSFYRIIVVLEMNKPSLSCFNGVSHKLTITTNKDTRKIIVISKNHAKTESHSVISRFIWLDTSTWGVPSKFMSIEIGEQSRTTFDEDFRNNI